MRNTVPPCRFATAILLACSLSVGACAHRPADPPNSASAQHESSAVTARTQPVADSASPLAGPSVDELARIPRTRVSNTRCPIDAKGVGRSNSALEPLTRKHDGKTIGFCSNWCASIWDAMTLSSRQAAMESITPKPKKK